jgi:unsaturated chondroitin disaccharide hydrolase
MAVCYRAEPKGDYLEAFENLLSYFLRHLPDDLVPYWDLTFTDGNEPRDSSSTAIVACGLLDMAGLVGGSRADELRELARRMLGSLWRSYAVRDPAVSNGLLLHGTYSKKTPFNSCKGEGVDECVAWGDYYYFEGLTRLSRQWTPYW